MVTIPDYVIRRDEGSIKVFPASEEVREFLTMDTRDLQFDGRRSRMVHSSEPLYVIEKDDIGNDWLSGHQGSWKDLSDYLLARDRTVQLDDLRQPFPMPDLSAAMRCLRPYQQDWISTALLQDCSGLIGAVTRFGKSYGMEAICRAYPTLRIIVVAPGRSLCKQLYDHFVDAFCPPKDTGRRPTRQVCGVFGGSKHRSIGSDTNSITIVSADSLHKIDPALVQLMLVDEPHAMVAKGRLAAMTEFYSARKYGFGATLSGRFDKRDQAISAFFGPVLSNVTYKQAVAMDAICPLKVLFLKVPFSKDTVPGKFVDRTIVYKRLLTQSANVAGLIKQVMDDAIPQDFQTMAFIIDEKQADYYMAMSIPPDGTVAMAKKMTDKARDILTEEIAAGAYMRVVASNIYVQGITFPSLQVVVNLAGGGANTTAIQKPGRLLQRQNGKHYGVLIDLLFECRDDEHETRRNPPYQCVVSECWARHKAYKQIGYDIEIISSIDELAAKVRASRD